MAPGLPGEDDAAIKFLVHLRDMDSVPLESPSSVSLHITSEHNCKSRHCTPLLISFAKNGPKRRTLLNIRSCPAWERQSAAEICTKIVWSPPDPVLNYPATWSLNRTPKTGPKDRASMCLFTKEAHWGSVTRLRICPFPLVRNTQVVKHATWLVCVVLVILSCTGDVDMC